MKQTKFAKKQNFHSDTGAFPPPVRESTGGKLGLFVCALVGCILLSCKTPPAPAVEKPAETAQAEAAQEAVAAEPVRPPPDLPRYILRAEERLDKLDTPVNPELPEPPFNDMILMADETKEPPLPEPPLPIPPPVETAAAPPPSAAATPAAAPAAAGVAAVSTGSKVCRLVTLASRDTSGKMTYLCRSAASSVEAI